MNLFELFVKIGVNDEASKNIEKISQKLGKGLKTAAKIGTAAVGLATTGIIALTKQAVSSYAEFEQLAGGAAKIFDKMSQTKILADANNAYKELGISANEYLAIINDVGATFAATMGDEKGYEAAKTGLKAISDYASGTGKNIDELSQKFTLITRSTASYQSIADQFSGILPATSAGFLEQAQAAGILSNKYKTLTEVPIDEYQAAVSKMLEEGVKDLGLYNNTMDEAFSTLSGSLSMARASWKNLVTGVASDTADLNSLISNFVESAGAVADNLIPRIGVALNGASQLVRDLIPVIMEEIPVIIEENLPILAEAAVGIVQSLVDGISQNQEMLFTTVFDVITYLAETFITMLPQIVQLGFDLLVSLANGIAQSLPTLIPTIIDVILQIVNILTNADNMALILDAALTIITELAWGITNNIDKVIDAVFKIIDNMVAFLTNGKNIGKLIGAAIQIVVAIGTGLIKAIPQLLASTGKLILSIKDTFTKFDWGSLGRNLVDGFKKGISNAWGNLKRWFKSLFGDLVGIAKKILGIASPSKVFKKLGGWTAEGFGEGFDDVFGDVEDDIENALDFSDADYGVTSSTTSISDFGASSRREGEATQNVNVTVGIDDSANAMGLARALLPFLKVAEKEAYA